jgi:hypothetical protein
MARTRVVLFEEGLVGGLETGRWGYDVSAGFEDRGNFGVRWFIGINYWSLAWQA